MSLESICRAIVTQHHYIAAGVVDLETSNKLASYHKVGYFTDAYIEMVSIAAAQMFYSPTITKIEELIAAQRNQPFQRHIEEIYFRTAGTHHFICKVPGKAVVLVVVTPIHADRDSGWDVTKAQLEHIAPYCPDAVKA